MDWKNLFSKVILTRGADYFNQGRVINLSKDGNTCFAAVDGRDLYSVLITDIGKPQMRMSCDCPHAKKGYACKHMAAVLYAYESQYGADEPSDAEDIFVKEDSAEYFYDMSEITSPFIFSKETAEKARKLIENGSLTLAGFDTQLVPDFYSMTDTCKAAVIGRYSEGDDSYKLELTMDDRNTISYVCHQCGDRFYTWSSGEFRTEPCEHITGLFMLADKYIKLYDPGDLTDNRAMHFFDVFGKESVKNAANEKNARKSVIELQPRIVETRTGTELHFKIGKNGKLYFVKNLREIRNNFYERKEMKLGKNMSIDFGVETFNEESEKLFQTIEREIKQFEPVESMFPGSYIREKGILFTGDAVDTTYSVMNGKTIGYRGIRGGKDRDIQVREADPDIRINLSLQYNSEDEKEELAGIYVSGKLPHIIDGLENRYFLSNDTLSIIDDNLTLKLKPFLSLCNPNTGEFGFLVGRKMASEFYHRILPEFMEDPVFTIEEDSAVELMVKEKAEFSFFLDSRDGKVLCTANAAYGDKVFRLKDRDCEELPLDRQRDPIQEARARATMDELFEGYDDNRDEFFFYDDGDTMYEFLDSGINKLFALGDVSSTDAFSKKKIKHLPVVQIGVGLESNLLDLTIQNQDMTSEELAELLDSYKLKKKYHRLKNGEFVDLETNESVEILMNILDATGAKLKDFVKGKMKLPAYRALYLEKMLEGHEELVADRDRTYRSLIRNFKTIEDVDYDVPESLQSVLRPYQAYGFKWMKTLESAGFGGILADDMGLGKTLQMLSVLLSDKESREDGRISALVVCPASLVFNWAEEIAEFVPELKAVPIVGTKKERREILSKIDDADILVTSYNLLKRDIELYEELEFTHQIIDEAQYIKNARSAAAKSVKLIHAEHRFALSGTPIENRLSELWSVFDFLMPGFLHSYDRFRKTFETPISKNKDINQTETLKNMVSPFLLRRKKADVLKDLPEKIEEMHFAKFEDEQQKLYDAQVDRMINLIESKNDEFENSKIEILAELTKIRQICCDPGLIFENYKGGSAKRDACIDLVKSAIEGEHKVLLFSQFTSMLAMLEESLKEEDINYYKLTGSTPKEERLKLVKAFNSNDVPVFLISLKAGGTGLNLTGADIVIHYDPWWNRAAQDQATDRAHRIGQEKDVTVYQLIAKNSIEERIVKLQNDKKELADAILAGETRSIGQMSREELLELLDC